MSITSNLAPGAFPGKVATLPAKTLDESLAFTAATFVTESDADAAVVSVPFIEDPQLATFAAEAAPLVPGDLGLAQLDIITRNISQVASVSFEAAAKISDVFGNSLRSSLVRSLDYYFLNNDNPSESLGVFEQATGGNFNLDDNLEGLLNAIDSVLVNGGTPDRLVVSPTFLTKMRQLVKESGSNEPLLGINDPGNIFGLDVILSHVAPLDSAIVISSDDVLTAISPIQLRTQDDLKNSSVLIHGNIRAGWKLTKTNRLAVLTSNSGS
jgi:hypothetical protein